MIKQLLTAAAMTTLVACGGGGGGNEFTPHTPVIEDVKPAPLTTCGEWVQNGDGTESRHCKETIDGVVSSKWTETREAQEGFTCNADADLFYNSREVDFEASGIGGYTCNGQTGEVTDLTFNEGYSIETLVFIEDTTIGTGTDVTIEVTPTVKYFTPSHISNGDMTVPVYVGHDQDDHVDDIITAGNGQVPNARFIIAEAGRDDTVRGRLEKDGSTINILEKKTNTALAISIDEDIQGLRIFASADASYHLASIQWSLEGNLDAYTSFGREVTVSAAWTAEILATRNQFNVYSVQNANETWHPLAETATNHGGTASPLADAVAHLDASLDRTLYAGAIDISGEHAMARIRHDGFFIQHMVFVDKTPGSLDSTSNASVILAAKIAEFASANPEIEVEDLKEAFIEQSTEMREMIFWNGDATYTMDVRVAL